jgi:adenosyl cobinamide kinase/adenosyl cobinamide phosphate guanylyltransferase
MGVMRRRGESMMKDNSKFIFVTGGAYQGKLNYALSLFAPNPVIVIEGDVIPEAWFTLSHESCNWVELDAVRIVFTEEEPDEFDTEKVALDTIVNHAEMMAGTIRSLSMTPEKALDNLLLNIKRSNQFCRLIIISDEIGSGVVPLGKEARLDREYAGRLAVACASKASQVVHVLAGIPIVIK